MSTNSGAVVIGAGVIGLTLGNLLLDTGKYEKVIIIAEHIGPNDHPDYCSSKAGAHWRSMAEDKVHEEYDSLTYKKLQQLVNNKATPHIQEAQVTEVFTYTSNFKLPWFTRLTPNFKLLSEKELGNKYKYGYSYKSFIINTVYYLNWLKEQYTAKGGLFVQKKLFSIRESIEIFPRASLFVNCTGLGSRYLDDVKDNEVYPIRGQVILIKAPYITKSKIVHTGDDNKACYMIPKGDGTVVLGGTKIKNDFTTKVDPLIAKEIIDRCGYYMEELNGSKYEVIKQYSALRPGRKSGVCMKVGFINHSDSRSPPIILAHCYGHGGFGIQSSWGSCQKLIEKIDYFIASNQSISKL